MKKIFLFAVLIGQLAVGQEAGKVGQFIENQATTQQKNVRKEFNWANSKIDFNRKQTSKYRWNPNYGYTEVFLRIPEEGQFMVEVDDQMMANNTGRFRFFDVSAGNTRISIYQNGFLIYRTFIPTQVNTRSVLDFFSDRGLYLLSVYPVGNQQYGIDDWNNVWNDFYNTSQMMGGFGIMNDATFSQFLKSLENNWFDDGKISFIEQQSKSVNFTALQIKQLLQKLSMDNNRLKLAKKLYHQCIDRNNFFMVYDAFDFDSYKRNLTEYIKSL